MAVVILPGRGVPGGSVTITRHLLVTFIASVWLVGCTSFPAKMAGQFNGQRGDAIMIKKDGSLFWSAEPGQSDTWRFVGIATPDRQYPTNIGLTVPSSSPFPYPKVAFSSDYSHVTLDWGALKGAAGEGHSAEYDRQN